MLCCALLMCLRIGDGGSGREEDLPSAEIVLGRMELGVGDPAERGKLRSLLMKGRIVIEGMPGDATFEYLFQGDQRARFNLHYPSMPMQTQGTTGSMTWSSDAALGISISEGEEQGFERRLFDIERRAPWKKVYGKAETVAKEEIDGRACFKVRMSPKSGNPDFWYVDCEKATLVRIDGNVPDMMGGHLLAAFYFDEWKAIGGFTFPHRKVMKVGDMAIDHRYESIEINAAIEPEQIAPPPEVVAAWKDPSKRSRSMEAKPGEYAIETLRAQPVASIQVTIKTPELSAQLAILLPEVMSCLTAQGAAMAGPPFSRFLRVDGDTIDLEAGIPVKDKIKSSGRVLASELPGGRAVSTWHVGDYSRLTECHAALREWLKSHDFRQRGGFWEIYWTDPGIEPDPARWRTQILWPIE